MEQQSYLPINEEMCWRGVVERDAALDGAYVYGVGSTGVYCRPSCHSRPPRRENVRFFPLPEVAERAGFRPCKRCRPQTAAPYDPQLEQAQAICRYIQAHAGETLTLTALGQHFALSPTHLQRLFKQVVGITPFEYQETFRMEQVKSALRNGQAISDATYDAGFGSSSGLYGRAASRLGMTPRAYQKGGEGATIGYTIADSPLGRLLVAATGKGICAIRLGDADDSLVQSLRDEFGQATIERDDERLAGWVRLMVRHLQGQQPHLELPLDVRATAFQRQVWQALQAIPYGQTRTYTQVAEAIGRPDAARAVANACATNPVAIVVPCHRVVRSDGGLGGYRWGLARKEALLRQEAEIL